MAASTRSVLLALLVSPLHGLDNGFKLPAMGYSSWNDCGSFRNNGPEGWCWNAEEHIKNDLMFVSNTFDKELVFRNAETGEVFVFDKNGIWNEEALKHPLLY